MDTAILPGSATTVLEAEVSILNLCCWCDKRATHNIVHTPWGSQGTFWRDPACEEHAKEHIGSYLGAFLETI